jgi:hypothetical protein
MRNTKQDGNDKSNINRKIVRYESIIAIEREAEAEQSLN